MKTLTRNDSLGLWMLPPPSVWCMAPSTFFWCIYFTTNPVFMAPIYIDSNLQVVLKYTDSEFDVVVFCFPYVSCSSWFKSIFTNPWFVSKKLCWLMGGFPWGQPPSMVILLVAQQLLPMKILPCGDTSLGFPTFDLKGHILAGASMVPFPRVRCTSSQSCKGHRTVHPRGMGMGDQLWPILWNTPCWFSLIARSWMTVLCPLSHPFRVWCHSCVHHIFL